MSISSSNSTSSSSVFSYFSGVFFPKNKESEEEEEIFFHNIQRSDITNNTPATAIQHKEKERKPFYYSNELFAMTATEEDDENISNTNSTNNNNNRNNEKPQTEDEMISKKIEEKKRSQVKLWKEGTNGVIISEEMTGSKRVNSVKLHDNCWLNPPDEPWRPSFYLTERGLDNIHIYFWITKDLCWVQSWLFPGLVVGSLACLYALGLSARALFWRKHVVEFWIKMTEFMWLFANFWWMIGELHDDHFNYFDTDKSIVDKHTYESGIMFICTLVWISAYYLVLKPLNLLEETEEDKRMSENEATVLHPRFSFFFKTWSEYEHIHVFFWVGKDTAWNWWLQSMWVVFFVPTFLIGLDFVYLTIRSKRLVIDHAHYFAQFLWVVANAVWAGGEFWFTPNNDEPIPISRFTSEARHTSRWYSGWVVLAAYLPLLLLYVNWLYFTYIGGIPPLADHVMSTEKDKMYDSSNSRHSSRNDSSHSSSYSINPLIPMFEVSVQSNSEVQNVSKSSFKVNSQKSGDSRSNSSNIEEEEIRLSNLSNLSNANGVITGAEV